MSIQVHPDGNVGNLRHQGIYASEFQNLLNTREKPIALVIPTCDIHVRIFSRKDLRRQPERCKSCALRDSVYPGSASNDNISIV